MSRHSARAWLNFERILLKISGEALAGDLSFGLDPERVKALASEVAEVAKTGVQVGLVLGGGNIFRGVAAAANNMDRVTGDHMGMLATVINALAFQDALEHIGHPHPCDDGHRDASGGGALYSAAGDSASGKGPRGNFRGGHFESILLNRYGGDTARIGD